MLKICDWQRQSATINSETDANSSTYYNRRGGQITRAGREEEQQ
jgi:hypothetical protein